MSGVARVVVGGGGIGGLAASAGLANAGFEVEVVERVPESDHHVGSGIVLTPNGMRALAALDAEAAAQVTAAGVASGSGHRSLFLSAKGSVLSSVSLAEFAGVYGVPSVSITRARLREVLARRAEAAGVRITHGRAVTGVREDPVAAKAVVTLDTGEELAADVVVGADGVRSTVRAHVGGGEPRYCGYAAVYGFAPAPDEHPYGILAAGRGVQLFSSLVAPDTVYWVATVTAPAGTWPAKPPATARADVLALMRRWAPSLRTIVESGAADRDTPVLAVDVHDLDPVDTWHRGRVVLLGDAAHAMAPTLGQGAASALEDAAVLVHHLRTTAGVEDAFRAYTTDRAPRITRMARQARQLGRLGQITNPVGAWLRDRMMWLAGRFTGQDKPDDWLLGWHPPLPADRTTTRERGAT